MGCSVRLGSCRGDLGGADRRKTGPSTSLSIREIERQIELSEKEGTVIDPGIDKPFGVPPEFPDYFRLMTDMMPGGVQSGYHAHLRPS